MGGQPVDRAVLREPMAFLAALSAEKAKLKKTTPQEPTRAPTGAYPVVGMASIMAEKAHGTTAAPVQTPLRWGVDGAVADRICSFNRHGAERKGCWAETAFLAGGARDETFYDSVTGKPLFVAPRGRSWDAFVRESADHGWPSFRDDEVRWDNVRCLLDGECVSARSGAALDRGDARGPAAPRRRRAPRSTARTSATTSRTRRAIATASTSPPSPAGRPRFAYRGSTARRAPRSTRRSAWPRGGRAPRRAARAS